MTIRKRFLCSLCPTPIPLPQDNTIVKQICLIKWPPPSLRSQKKRCLAMYFPATTNAKKQEADRNPLPASIFTYLLIDAYRFAPALRQIVIWRGELPPSQCRGGYHPPAQWGFPILHFVGRIRTNLDNYPFNQTRGYPTWREANMYRVVT